MSSGFWLSVMSQGMRIPAGRRLEDLTSELGEMLGDPDPHVREGLALPILVGWATVSAT